MLSDVTKEVVRQAVTALRDPVRAEPPNSLGAFLSIYAPAGRRMQVVREVRAGLGLPEEQRGALKDWAGGKDCATLAQALEALL